MNIIGIIPARMASSRFPGKPLAEIMDMPMIGHVYHRSKMCDLLNEVCVATCDKEISDYTESIGGKVIMTADTHERASDRTAEAMIKIEAKTGQMVDIVVMIQGDEPMLHPDMINEALKPMINDELILITNLMARIKTIEEFEDSNEVKVVVDKFDNALYFSREPIPSRRKGIENVLMLKQVCIIPFRRDFLLKFNQLEPSQHEMIESVDMLRILEHGYKVKMVSTNMDTYSVDTLEDLQRVENIMKNDPLVLNYTGR